MVYNNKEIIDRIFNEMHAKMEADNISSVDKFIEKYEIGYTRQNLYKLRRTGQIPDIHTLLKFCTAFDCELGWLLGEQDYKHYKSQTIRDAIWPLSEKSAEILSHLSPDETDCFDDFVSHPDFLNLLWNMVHFTIFSQKEELYASTIGSNQADYIDLDEKSLKSVKKYIVTEIFSQMLDDIYEWHSNTDFEVLRLKDIELDCILDSKERGDNKDDTFFFISDFQDSLMKLSPSDPLCYYSYEYFYDHIEEIHKEHLEE